MFSKILILVGILAASNASADVPLSVEHGVTYALAESIGISSTRSLRAMTEQTAMSVTASSVCDTMSDKSGGLLNLLVLLDLILIGATMLKMSKRAATRAWTPIFALRSTSDYSWTIPRAC
ncbi:unnamed protein product [Peronospora belbahrii]|uniref:Uncharacterized protein n=1 Tax=Peronospora belbahrii TaxID=622444 RepID=A0AAU9L0P8_9STRA|nr:unnamed protein product [Peronospora belbahrii]